MTFEEAVARLIKQNEKLDFLPKIVSNDFDAGGDYQIGDMTWDHDNASITVQYRHPDHTPGKTFSYYVDLEYYQGQTPGRTGFAAFIDDLLSVSTRRHRDT